MLNLNSGDSMNKTNLSNDKCGSCNNLTPVLSPSQRLELQTQLQGWSIVEGHHLQKRWSFKNFAKPLKFVLAISELAEKEGHHPNINFGWGYVELTLWTHAINGLSRNDFVLAAKIDNLLK